MFNSELSNCAFDTDSPLFRYKRSINKRHLTARYLARPFPMQVAADRIEIFAHECSRAGVHFLGVGRSPEFSIALSTSYFDVRRRRVVGLGFRSHLGVGSLPSPPHRPDALPGRTGYVARSLHCGINRAHTSVQKFNQNLIKRSARLNKRQYCS